MKEITAYYCNILNTTSRFLHKNLNQFKAYYRSIIFLVKIIQWAVSHITTATLHYILSSPFNIPYIYLYMFRYVANVVRVNANAFNDGLRGKTITKENGCSIKEMYRSTD